jgi:hypothetical protein
MKQRTRRIRTTLLAAAIMGLAAVVPDGDVAQAGSVAPKATAGAWLPSPYIQESKYTLDIDADGDSDEIVVGVDGPATASSSIPEGDENRVLIVARKDKDGYRPLGIGTKALLCRRCGGAFNVGAIPPIDVSATKNGFVITQSAGANEITEWIHRYRLEKNRIRLIGVDIAETDRNVGSTVTRSTNLLTGVTKTTVEGKPTNKVKAGTVKGKPRTVYLEAVTVP